MLTRWFKALRSNAVRPSAPVRRPPNRTHLGVEALEDRFAPAIVPWVGGVDLNWQNPANWAGGVLPDSTSDVVIDGAFVGATIASNANVSIRSLNSAAALTISNGTTFSLGVGSSVIANTVTLGTSGATLIGAGNFNVARVVCRGTWRQDAAATIGSLSFDGGKIYGAGNIAVSGTFSWTAGLLGDTSDPNHEGKLSLGARATGSISSTASKSVVRVLENAGQLTFNGDSLALGASTSPYSCVMGYLNNLPSGTFIVQGASPIRGPGGLINNQGNFAHNGSGTTTVYTGVTMNNTGTVSVGGGTLILQYLQQPSSTRTLAGGTWNVADNSTLTLWNRSLQLTTNNGNITLTGANSVFTNLNALTTNNGTFRIQGGRTFTTAGSFTNTGTITIDAASRLAVSGDFTQTTGGILNADVAATGAMSDRLTVAGISTVAGTINTTLPAAVQDPDALGSHGGVLFYNGLLYIQGTSGDDRIVLRQNLGQITIEGMAGTFAANQVSWIVVLALGGNDYVNLATDLLGSEAITAPSAIFGGAGNDSLFGGAGNDLVHGGDGDDFIGGHAGVDLLLGGNGVDWLFGGAGNDLLDGGADYDFLDGQGGLDRVYDDSAYFFVDLADLGYFNHSWLPARSTSGNSTEHSDWIPLSEYPEYNYVMSGDYVLMGVTYLNYVAQSTLSDYYLPNSYNASLESFGWNYDARTQFNTMLGNMTRGI